MSVDLSIAGKAALISGGSRGIGAATVRMFTVDYAATKGALISMAKGLATELSREGICVNCVAPGWVDTELVASALEDRETRRRVAWEIPLGRRGKPEEVAAGILFLCAEHAGFVTEEVLNINGGEALIG